MHQIPLFLPAQGGIGCAEESEARTRKVCRVQGIAVCWSPGAVYYIPLNPATAGVSKLIGSMLGCKRTPKITYNLKSQMLALLAGESALAEAIGVLTKGVCGFCLALYLQLFPELVE